MPFRMIQLRPNRPGFLLWLWTYGWGGLILFLAFTPLLILNVFQFMSLALLPIWETGYRAFNTGVSLTIWGYWAWCLEHVIGLRIRYVGDTLPRRESSIVIANHQGFMDIMALLCFESFLRHEVRRSHLRFHNG